MVRVTEQSNILALRHAMNKAKQKVEDLQLKGSSLKQINRPSDDPSGSVDVLSYGSRLSDNDQFIKNSDYALLHLKFLEDSLEELTDTMVRAKEITISQSSDLYDTHIRSGVARELIELKNQALGIANRRFGNRFIFGGHATLHKPFNSDAQYLGDTGRITVEVSKDNFVPINFTGIEVFYSSQASKDKKPNPLSPFQVPKPDVQQDPSSNKPPQDRNLDIEVKPGMGGRDLASIAEPDKKNFDQAETLDENYKKFSNRDNIFGQLTTLIAGMEANDTDLIQDMLEKLDDSIDRLVTIRTKVGSITNSVEKAKSALESENLIIKEHRSKVGDADVADIFVDLNKQQHVLKATYKSGQALLNSSLLEFLR